MTVGIIHSNGEHMSEEPNGEELLRFAVTFIMSWKIWTDITMALSWFETDDVITRLEILFEIACLLAYVSPNPQLPQSKYLTELASPPT